MQLRRLILILLLSNSFLTQASYRHPKEPLTVRVSSTSHFPVVPVDIQTLSHFIYLNALMVYFIPQIVWTQMLSQVSMLIPSTDFTGDNAQGIITQEPQAIESMFGSTVSNVAAEGDVEPPFFNWYAWLAQQMPNLFFPHHFK